jgi:AcrR family transcriptional regulator
MAGQVETAGRIVECAMILAAERGWRHTGLGDVAAAADVSLADLHTHFGSKIAILAAFVNQIDGAVLAGVVPMQSDEEDEGESVRDRLFDVLMRRFDALKPHKDAIRRIARDLPRDPLAMICFLPHQARSLAWMLESAGVSSAGVRGRVRTRGLGLVYLSALRAWFRDDTEDMSATMAALDRALGQADAAVRSAPFRCL